MGDGFGDVEGAGETREVLVEGKGGVTCGRGVAWSCEFFFSLSFLLESGEDGADVV